MWMFFVLVYGLLKGFREILKKKSLEVNSVMEVLFFYTLFSFIMVSFDVKRALGVPLPMMGWIFVKSFVIFCAWILSFKAIKKMPISLYGVLDLSRVLFATLLGVIFLSEKMTTFQIIGLILVSAGLLLLKVKIKIPAFQKLDDKMDSKSDNVSDESDDEKDNEKEEKIAPLVVCFALMSCLLNAVSGFMDKVLMKDLNSSQLQFWYMLFLVSLYGVYLLISREKVQVKKAVCNPYIWLLAFLFVVADRALFLANGDPNSRVTVMTLIKQSGCIVTLGAGRFIYHEKHVLHRLICTILVVAGIVIAVL